MTDAVSATVEVLTAEVRTLMVGSRQVTLSVFKQLDEVALDQLTPMGRVNPPKPRPYALDLVGVDAGGVLVRSVYWKPAMEDYRGADGFVEREAYRADVEACRAFRDSLPLIVLAGLR